MSIKLVLIKWFVTKLTYNLSKKLVFNKGLNTMIE